MYRDLENTPYRETEAYRRARDTADKQKAGLRHQVRQLWPSSAPSASAMLRRPRFACAG